MILENPKITSRMMIEKKSSLKLRLLLLLLVVTTIRILFTYIYILYGFLEDYLEYYNNSGAYLDRKGKSVSKKLLYIYIRKF